MKEMYLKVKVEDIKGIDFVDVFFRKGKYFTCPKDDAELVEIEDAEEKGAEKLAESISYIIGELVNGESQKVGEAFGGRVEVRTILQNFSPKVINYRVEKMKHHVPTQGDVYRSRHTNVTAVVLSFNKETRETRYVAPNFASCEKEDYLNEHYCFTGENIDVSALVNKIGLN